MKRTIIPIICLAVALALFVSCSAGTTEDCTATVRFALGSSRTRTIGPDHDTLVASSYEFSFANTTQDGASFTRTVEAKGTGSYTIKGVVPGQYVVTVNALNSSGTVLATANKTYRFLAGLNSYSMELTSLKGKGNLEVAYTWDPNLFVDNSGNKITPTVNVSLKTQAGDTVALSESEFVLDADNGKATVTKTDLASGSYLISINLYNGNTYVTGAVEVIRIADGQTSSGTINFAMGGTLKVSGFALTDNTSAPITGTIVPSRTFKEGDEAAEISFSVTFDYLPDGITADDITIDWYDEDILATSNSATSSFLPYSGTSRITAVFKCDKIGSMGSATIDFYYPYL